jgi:hypothetical protein
MECAIRPIAPREATGRRRSVRDLTKREWVVAPGAPFNDSSPETTLDRTARKWSPAAPTGHKSRRERRGEPAKERGKARPRRKPQTVWPQGVRYTGSGPTFPVVKIGKMLQYPRMFPLLHVSRHRAPKKKRKRFFLFDFGKRFAKLLRMPRDRVYGFFLLGGHNE